MNIGKAMNSESQKKQHATEKDHQKSADVVIWYITFMLYKKVSKSMLREQVIKINHVNFK